MSLFVIDPAVFGPKYGYSAEQNPFVNSRQGFNLDSNLKRGFKTAVNNGQMRLAMEYMQYMVDIIEDNMPSDFDSKSEAAEASTAKSRKTSKTPSPQASGVDIKEEVSSE